MIVAPPRIDPKWEEDPRERHLKMLVTVIVGMLVSLVATWIGLAVAFGQVVDDRYPQATPKAEPVRVAPRVLYRPPPTKINWLKPTKIRVPKQEKLPGKTINDPRSPLHLPEWGYQYSTDSVVKRSPIYLAGLVDRSPDYLVPITQVEVRPLKRIEVASLSGVVTTIAGASLAALTFSWWYLHRPNFKRKLKGALNVYLTCVECCVEFVTDTFRNRAGRGARYLAGHSKRAQQPRLPARGVQNPGWETELRRCETDLARHQSRHPDDSPLGAWSRAIPPQR